jgi:DNA-binding MarR family transcriptional regulator
MARALRHPGLLLRRAHQIAVSNFYDTHGECGVTPTQSAVLDMISMQPGLDQITVGRILGLDRATSATVIRKLAAQKLIRRDDDVRDQRRRTLFITPAGRRVLARVDIEKSRSILLSPFDADEAATFQRLLEKFVDSFNDRVRVPMESPEP